MKPAYIVFTFFDGRCRRKIKISDHVTVRELSRIEDFCHQKILEIGKKKHEKRKKDEVVDGDQQQTERRPL